MQVDLIMITQRVLKIMKSKTPHPHPMAGRKGRLVIPGRFSIQQHTHRLHDHLDGPRGVLEALFRCGTGTGG